MVLTSVELSTGASEGSESFLCMCEKAFGFTEVGEGCGEEAGPEFEQDTGHGDWSVVR